MRATICVVPIIVGAGDRIILPSGRESRLARNSVPWSGGSTPQHAQLVDGRTVSLRQLATEQPWVAVAVNGMARQVARLPWKVFRADGEAGRKRDRTSDSAQRLARPGLRRSQTSLKYDVMVGLLVDGNHVERKVTLPDGRPGLRKLDWRWLVPYELDGEVVVWEYRPPNGEALLLDPGDVVHYRWEAFEGGPLGVSPLRHLGVTVRSEDAAQRWAEGNFRNGTRVGLAVIMDKEVKADGDKREALRDEIVNRYAGPENAGRPIILGGGVSDVKPIGAQTPVEAALIEQRKVNRAEVLAVYGYPAPLAGDLEHATYSNVAELARILFRIVLPPWLELIQTETTTQLIGNPSPHEHYTEFDLNDATRGDIRERMTAYGQSIKNGILTVNEVRELENRETFDTDGADEPLIQANNLKPLSRVVAEAAAEATGQPAPADDPAAVDPATDA